MDDLLLQIRTGLQTCYFSVTLLQMLWNKSADIRRRYKMAQSCKTIIWGMSLITGYKEGQKEGFKTLRGTDSSMIFLAVLIFYPQSNARIPPPPVHLSMYHFKKSPCHVAFHSHLHWNMFRPCLQRAAAVPGTCYSPSCTPISHPLSHTLHMSHACRARKCCLSKCTATQI